MDKLARWGDTTIVFCKYCIVGFFEARKFHEFHRCWSFMKFNLLKKPTIRLTHCSAWAFGRPIHEKNHEKTENQPFAEFKYLTVFLPIKTRYTVAIIVIVEKFGSEKLSNIDDDCVICQAVNNLLHNDPLNYQTSLSYSNTVQ